MNRPHLLTAITAVLFCLAPLAWSQPDQSSGAATEPAPYRMTTPPGMQTIQVGLYTGVCPQAYVSAVQNGLESVKEPKRPTTMPSDLVANLAAVHDKLATEMTNDLALSDPTVATTFLDTTVTDGLKRLAGITLKMYVLVGTQDEVRSAMLGGWNAPDNFHYNPDSNSVDYSDHAAFPVDRAPDDIVFWVQIDPAMTPADISELVAQRVQKFSDSITAALSQAGPQYTLRLMMNFVNNPNTKDTSADKQNMAWMHLPPSAEWFGLGVMGDLGAKYTAEITGFSRADLTAAIDQNNPSNPIQPGTIDLLHPLNLQTDIRPEYVGVYREAMTRKAIRVVAALVTKEGDDALDKLIAAVKANPPANNAAMVDLIKSTTGFDPTSAMGPTQ